MKPVLTAALAGISMLALGACELAPKESYQTGYRGTGMNSVMVKASAVDDEVPAPPYDPPGTAGPRAGEVYENVEVLGDISVDQFNYTMAAITAWVAPEEGCAYCHNPANMASDEKYTLKVSRQMLEMTRELNRDWTNHVGNTGVTCWTCHRGEPVPNEYWTLPEDAAHQGIVGNKNGQNDPVSNSAYSSLPNAAVARYLLGGPLPQTSRVITKGVFPTPENTTSTMEAEQTYAIMLHISQALGVNCTYCHNSQSFQSWENSNPFRETAYYGLDMVRRINFGHISPLADVFPANRKGPLGDPFKVNCTTCHRGQNKPLGGVAMAWDYPALMPTMYSAAIRQADARTARERTEVAAE